MNKTELIFILDRSGSMPELASIIIPANIIVRKGTVFPRFTLFIIKLNCAFHKRETQIVITLINTVSPIREIRFSINFLNKFITSPPEDSINYVPRAVSIHKRKAVTYHIVDYYLKLKEFSQLETLLIKIC